MESVFIPRGQVVIGHSKVSSCLRSSRTISVSSERVKLAAEKAADEKSSIARKCTTRSRKTTFGTSRKLGATAFPDSFVQIGRRESNPNGSNESSSSRLMRGLMLPMQWWSKT